MKKQELANQLLENGFELTNYKNYERTFNNLKITVSIYDKIFGKIKMISLMYKFKKELKEELHDEVWDKSMKIIDSQNLEFRLGSLGFEYLEACIIDKKILADIDASTIIKCCNRFSNLITGLINEYEL